jgi:hypothetical protein
MPVQAKIVDETGANFAVVDSSGHLEIVVGAEIPAGTKNIGDVDVLTLPSVVLTAETTKVIGTVNVSASQTIGLSTGTAEIGKLAAGVALMGKVGIDQTTLGTTNGVSLVGDITEWSVTQTSTANTEQTLPKASGGGTTKHVVTGFEVVIRGAAAGADISVQLKDGSTVKWQTYLGSGALRGERVGIVFAHGIEMTAATAVTLVVGAGGASVISEANMAGYTKAA